MSTEERTPDRPADRPATWRDPWAWLSALAVLPVVLATRGTPRGEPVAEDFSLLRRALLEGGGSLLDGGGGRAFWRPVANQLYFRAFGETILAHPGWIAALHTALLALAAVLLYRVLRQTWSGPLAAAAASFPLFAESARGLVCWPSHFADVGAILFLVLALHERVFHRPASALLAMLAALLCKETAVVGVLLIPFAPDRAPDARRPRAVWVVATGAVVVAWAAAYAWVRAHSRLELPHGLERDPAILAVPFAARAAWAIANSLRAIFSLAVETRHALTAAVAGALVILVALAIARDPRARERWRAARSWAAWGGAWSLGSWLALTSIFPLWSPYRSLIGGTGLGVAAVAAAGAVHPALPLGLAVARLGLFALAPGTPRGISPEAPSPGVFMDYPRLSRLEQLMAGTRSLLKERYPTLPHGSAVGYYLVLPLGTEYAFGGAHALQCWYRDTSLRWGSAESLLAHPAQPVATFVCYQPVHRPQLVLLDAEAVRSKWRGVGSLRAGHWRESLAELARADSLQHDRRAVVFLGDVAGRRAYCWAQLGEWARADSESRVALRAARADVGARYVAAAVHAVRHETVAALADLDTLLSQTPGDPAALEMRRTILLAATPARR
jgi:hypothetical protein